jgi:hypothetical protein
MAEPKVVECLMGPYRGQHILLSDAEASQAISEKWAREVTPPPIDANADVKGMTPEETEAAATAANAWAAKRAEPVPPSPEQKPAPKQAQAPRPEPNK